MKQTAAMIETRARRDAREFLLASILSTFEAIEQLDAVAVEHPESLRRLSARWLYQFAEDIGAADAQLRALAARLCRRLKVPAGGPDDDEDDGSASPTEPPDPPPDPPRRKPAPRQTRWPLLLPNGLDGRADDE